MASTSSLTSRQWIFTLGLVLLVLAAAIGFSLTAGTPEQVPVKLHKKEVKAAEPPLVDESPLTIARSLAAVAATPEEQDFDRQAQKVGDHEVDLAFADALRAAAQTPIAMTLDVKAMFDRRAKTEAAVKADDAVIADLTKRMAGASENAKDNLQDQIDVAQAQLELDQDELDDAKEDIDRANADPQARIQHLLDAHEASHKDAQNGFASANSAEADYQARNLLAQVKAWKALRDHTKLIEAARDESVAKIQLLGAKHSELDKRVTLEEEGRQNTKKQAAGFAQAGGGAASRDTATAALASLKHFTADQKSLADYDKRIQDEQQLIDLYGSWLGLVAVHQRIALHGMMLSSLWIAIIILLAYLGGLAIDHWLADPSLERTRLKTLRIVIRSVVQFIAALIILFVIFGAPSQTPTVLGLAGAGLTVALKDFIVAFVGWFVLMGKNGMRVGDWVEINGVAGEVIEIGLLRTVLLETGNWTDTGHPTGRKVAFVNSFAIEGHFFNFSTTGQWLWDEIDLVVPMGEDPYKLIAKVQAVVEKETAPSARAAEEEWAKSTAKYRVQSASAAPAIHLQPTASGVQIHVRYITQAHERNATRAHLYEALVGLLHAKAKPAEALAIPVPATT